MQIRTASTGVFMGCSGYSLPPKERCKSTVNLIPGDEAISVDADDEAESRLLLTKRRCGKCNTAMDSYLIDETRKLHVCGNNPDCDGYEVEQGQFRIKLARLHGLVQGNHVRPFSRAQDSYFRTLPRHRVIS